MAGSDVADRLDSLVRSRIRIQKDEIEHSLKQIAAGNPLGAEPSSERRLGRLMRKTNLSARDAEAMSSVIDAAASAIDSGHEDLAGAEAIQGPTIDYVGVEFLTRGRTAANAVGRVISRDGRGIGTGFLVGPGLLITNNHVIADAAAARAMAVEFDFEVDDSGRDRLPTVFGFDPGSCFVYDGWNSLDFTLVALGARLSGDRTLESLGYIALSDAGDKHMLGEIANIIQHPEASRKQIVVRENNLVARDETAHVLHYVADTEPGSSGSPVCNNDWEPIALHHWGGPHLELQDATGKPLRKDINEGIRISSIVTALKQRRFSGSARGSTVADLIALWTSRTRRERLDIFADPAKQPAAPSAPGPQARRETDGSVTWTFPIEINVRAPLLAPPAAAPDPSSATAREAERRTSRPAGEDYAARDGYEPGFLQSVIIPLPDLSGVPYRLARNLQAGQGDDPHELRYHHFSILMNAERRLAALTACNIDGARTVAINRDTKAAITDPSLKDLGVESLGPESSDDFHPDPRVADDEQMTRPFYDDQSVPGYEKPEFPGKDATEEEKKAYRRAMAERTARMFQKGHIIMRGDPAWGTESAARLAEADTFHYTNAAPQLGFFNQGSPDDRPGIKGRLRWRAVETYVLRNAVTMRSRITVFAGPVFDDSYDVDYRFGSKLPMRFFKLVVWVEDDGLRSIALLADQKKVLEELTKGVPEAMERFQDPDELTRVPEYLTTVAEIERLTGIDFGEAVRNADVRSGQDKAVPVTEAAGFDLNGKRPRPVKAARRATRKSAKKAGS